MPENIRIQDKRKLNPLTKRPINPNRDLKSGYADAGMIKNMVRLAKDYGLDPNLMLAVGLQETNLGKIDPTNPYQVNAAYHGVMENPLEGGTAIFRDKYNKYPKKSEAYRIQAYNGLTSKTKADPVYGKSVISLRDSVIKQSPELQNYITEINKPEPIKMDINQAREFAKNNPNEFNKAFNGIQKEVKKDGGNIKYTKNENIPYTINKTNNTWNNPFSNPDVSKHKWSILEETPRLSMNVQASSNKIDYNTPIPTLSYNLGNSKINPYLNSQYGVKQDINGAKVGAGISPNFTRTDLENRSQLSINPSIEGGVNGTYNRNNTGNTSSLASYLDTKVQASYKDNPKGNSVGFEARGYFEGNTRPQYTLGANYSFSPLKSFNQDKVSIGAGYNINNNSPYGEIKASIPLGYKNGGSITKWQIIK